MSIKKRLSLVIILASLIGAVAVWYAQDWAATPGAIEDGLNYLKNNPATLWFLIALYIILGFFVVPLGPLTIVVAIIFGWYGLLTTTAGLVAAAAVSYPVGKLLGTSRVEKRFAKGGKIEKLMGIIERHGSMATMIIRLMFGVPFALQNLLLGAVGVAFIPYMLGTLLGSIIASSFYTMLGVVSSQAILELQHSLDYAWAVPVIGLVIGISLLIYDYFSKQPKEQRL